MADAEMLPTSYYIMRTKSDYIINLSFDEADRVMLLWKSGEKFLDFTDLFGASLCVPADHVAFFDMSTPETRERERELDRIVKEELPYDQRG